MCKAVKGTHQVNFHRAIFFKCVTNFKLIIMLNYLWCKASTRFHGNILILHHEGVVIIMRHHQTASSHHRGIPIHGDCCHVWCGPARHVSSPTIPALFRATRSTMQRLMMIKSKELLFSDCFSSFSLWSFTISAFIDFQFHLTHSNFPA